MNSKTTLSISEARKRIFEIAEEVQKPGKQYTLTENGVPKVVIMSAEEYESWLETMEVMRIFPDLDKKIAKVKNDIAKNDFSDYISFEEVKKKYGFVADAPKKKYGVRTPNPKKRR